jgi:DNA repair exonuclease SbcCD ATPase subunit
MDLKIKDFASMQGVSESIIYRHIRQHKDALGDRVIKRGNATWLTEEGQEYIRGLMTQQPIVVSDGDFQRQLDDLREENRNLLMALNLAKDTIIELKDGQARLEAAEKEKALLEETVQDAKKEIKNLIEEKAVAVAKAHQEAAEAAKRASAMQDDLAAEKAEKEALRAKLDALKQRNIIQRLFNWEV